MLARGIDIDCDDNCPSFGEFTMSECHADQLAVAIRSPIPTQKEQYHRMAVLIRQDPRFTALVEQCEVRRSRHPSNIDQPWSGDIPSDVEEVL